MTTSERHIVVIETERTGRMELTPDQFDLLLQAALVGLDGYEGPNETDADVLWEKLSAAETAHRV